MSADSSLSEAVPAAGRQPRVLHVDDQRGWRGGEQQMLYLARGLLRKGLQTAVVAQPDSSAAPVARRAGVAVHEVRMRGEADLGAALRIARIARGGGYDVLHSHTAHAQALVQLAAHFWRSGCKVVAHRRIEFPVGRRGFGLGRLKYRFGVDAYVAISNRVKRTLMEAGVPEWKVFPVRSSTDPERFSTVAPDPALRSELGIPAGAFVVGNIGALVGHKDHRNLLEACRIVRDSLPDTWVLIVGSGPLRQAVLDKAASLHMADRVVLPGFRWDIPQVIRTFDVFALSSSEEGLCSTLLEVAASGCPIVAADAGGVNEAVVNGKTGIVVPVRSPLALAQAILRLARDPQEARQFAACARERVLRHFTADAMTAGTLDVYRRVLSGEVGPERPVGFCED
jgi:glycosyltransferase involved in cell wall biosynthesis